MKKFRVTYYDPSFNYFTPRRRIIYADTAYDAKLKICQNPCIREIVSVHEVK